MWLPLYAPQCLSVILSTSGWCFQIFAIATLRPLLGMECHTQLNFGSGFDLIFRVYMQVVHPEWCEAQHLSSHHILVSLPTTRESGSVITSVTMTHRCPWQFGTKWENIHNFEKQPPGSYKVWKILNNDLIFWKLSVTFCFGLQEDEPQTAHLMSLTWASHIAASVLTLPNQSIHPMSAEFGNICKACLTLLVLFVPTPNFD